jgi:phosphonate transport system permease protein
MSVEVPLHVLPSRKFRVNVLIALAIVAILISSILYLGVDLSAISTDLHYVEELAAEMFPPHLQLLWEKSGLLKSLVETISMAFLGTVFGGCIALVLAFFAATNISPNPKLRLIIRGLLAAERSLPNFIVLLVLLIAVGIGPFAGMLSLTIGSVGMFGKLFADAIEQADKGTFESIQSVGSTRLQLIRYAILPEVAPSFIANLFYAFDVNLRAAIPLGVFGGGGIGFEFNFADRLLRYKDMLAYALVFIVLITGMERMSDWVRRQILTPQT